MNEAFFDKKDYKSLDRVDGRLKVTGAARYSAEYQLPGLVYAVLVESKIAKGTIKSIDSRAAERAPGVLAVISHVNAIKVPGYQTSNQHPSEPPVNGQPLRAFYDNNVYYNGQPIVAVVASTLEKAQFGASLVKIQYEKEQHKTDFDANMDNAVLPAQAKKNPKSPVADYNRGDKNAFVNAPVKIDAEYVLPTEVHNPMELQAITAYWEADDRLTLYDKVQGTQPTQQHFAKEWNLPPENVKVIATFVGGAFGNGLHNWPHETAAIIAAKQVKKPVKLVLTREQMFTMVGYRPYTWQKIQMGATKDGKLVAINHESVGQTSSYEEFTESTLQQTRMMYASPNVNTRYRILKLDVSTPIWMRGPGEATGAFALESAMDEMAFSLGMDPIEFRLMNYTDSDPDKQLPWSTKYLKECYDAGKEKIGWDKRKMQPGSVRSGEWLVGYGMGTGTFGANRGAAAVRAQLDADGNLLMQCAITDIGPGTGTAMVQIASNTTGISTDKIIFQLGNSQFPKAGNQGGSSTVNSVGPAVQAACNALKEQLKTMIASKGGSNAAFASAKKEDIVFVNGQVQIAGNDSAKVDIRTLFKQNNIQKMETTQESRPDENRNKYSMYAFSMHFAEVHVHPLTGQVCVKKVVCCGDAGTIISPKTAANQMIGGATGGIGMALTESAVIDHRFGRYVTKDFAEYHVPVHADVPHIEVFFVNKPDTLADPVGSKGLGEIAIIGVAPAIANAIFNATGKRIRELPITPDKLI
ncbi:xanthine dehydrogenase family protein molybdopterin-binding subunit [Dyadobacter sediminis]|uniref:Xanthine dehydrogenase family protein molybdopterin-binding subunit n=1 Tax=Dyadobacter sediminis TaxID=1493691 RepID=A0A5R9KC22_9BACT|nr:xanthine dehydrogenase family protein molybdopterin-binding subunit [Dyadobacter sediminis]TLU92361.1 xanthine dehydrogenase family protein molybdopterin-binding subunit [Dyadobacter sediminis]